MDEIIESVEVKRLSCSVIVGEDKSELELDMELLELEDTSSSDIKSLLSFQAGSLSPVMESKTSTSGNRRYSLRPKKRTLISISADSLSDIAQNLPSPTKKKCLSGPKKGCLETIFEHPEVAKNGNLLLLGKSKIKRFISFDNFVTRTKNRHRKLKVKRLSKTRERKFTKPKVTIEDVKQKLQSLESSNDEDEMVVVENS